LEQTKIVFTLIPFLQCQNVGKCNNIGNTLENQAQRNCTWNIQWSLAQRIALWEPGVSLMCALCN